MSISRYRRASAIDIQGPGEIGFLVLTCIGSAIGSMIAVR